MRTLLSLTVLLTLAATVRAELAPNEVGLVAMSVSRESRQVAEYYAKARGIPAANLCLLKGKPSETLSRVEWEEQVRPEILAWLRENDRQTRIRCLVACGDVPLRIDRRGEAAPEVVERKASLERARAARLEQVRAVLGLLDGLGATDKPAPREPFEPTIAVGALAGVFEATMKGARERLGNLADEDEKKKAEQMFEKVFVASGGIASMLNAVAKKGDNRQLPAEATRRLELAQAELRGLQKGLQALNVLPDTAARDSQILQLLQQTNGLLGTIQWIDEQRQLLAKNETYASFDSELSLILWPAYPLFLWVPNTLHHSLDEAPGKLPTMMVARLAAPQVELVTRLIDASLAAEKAGLEGKVYLDARGMAYEPERDKGASYAKYDQSLRDLAQRLRDHTKLDVQLDNAGGLFQPGSCPDAALYCGWYSLGNYVDAFTWRPGAVGYHIASIEGANLRSAGAKNWCPAMLADGIAATLGPVNEPYLAAFPLPDEFFSLLLTGRYTLVETYYRTKPFNSWQMILVGDPLYNPFKNRPLLEEKDLPEPLRKGN